MLLEGIMALMRRLIAAVLLCGATTGCDATKVTGTVVVGGDAEEDRRAFLSKFSYGLGQGKWKFNARLKNGDAMKNATARLEFLMDEKWLEVRGEPKCAWSPKDSRKLKLSTDQWFLQYGVINHQVRSHIWYFTLSVCGEADKRVPIEIEYEMTFTQEGGSELSVELRYMPSAVFLAVLCLTAFLARFGLLCRSFLQSAGELPPVILALAASVVLQWAAQVLHLYHLQAYEQQGFSESWAETIADMVFMLSQVVSSTLLLAIAKGYTLVGNSDNGSAGKMAAIIAALHVALVGHGKLQGDHAEAHHGLEGFAGVGILCLRFALFLIFIVRVKALGESSGGWRLHSFLQQFQVAGSLYLLSFPAIYMLGALFAPYLRFPIIHVGQVCFQTASAFWLSNLFLSRGAYFRVSSLSACILPGASPTTFKQD